MLLTDYPVPNSGIHHKQDNTKAFIDENDTGTGALYIAESQVTWLSSAGAGFCLEYPKICLHAISRDLSSFPHECLYLQVEGKLIEDDRGSNSSSEGDDDDDMPTTEVRFVPDDKLALEAMFAALSQCQILHPDPEDPDFDEQFDEREEGFYEGEEGAEELTEQGQVTLQRLENMLRAGQGDGANVEETNGHREEEEMEKENPNNAGQFDDADMEQ
ncbi:methylosome subunit pICln-like [Mercenaria mercenaria]|uniref:methylosome subunit pICln-like n=1 Tax=Mercenaria mercenaria TaxID=6596 RepID=UPI001E1E0D3D|nr:methylosome subunit pICln-like [Mercenaria mercenaria]